MRKKSPVCQSPVAGLIAAGLLIAGQPVWARYPAAVIKEYTGRHQDQYTEQMERVRLLVKQAQLEVSSRLGLVQYREGFENPLFIRFEDGAPIGVENALAYVALLQNGAHFGQELVVNLDATANSPVEFDQIFYHE